MISRSIRSESWLPDRFTLMMRSLVPGLSEYALSTKSYSEWMKLSFGRRIRRIAVVGGGPVAASWAAYYIIHGFDVIVADPALEWAENFHRLVDAFSREIPDTDLSAAHGAAFVLTSNLEEALLRADFVQECSAATSGCKADLLVLIDKVSRPDLIVATDAELSVLNTVRELLHHRDRWFCARSLDLPHRCPITFVLSAAETVPLAIRQAMKFYARVGRLPIYLRSEASETFTGGLLAMFCRDAAERQEFDTIGEPGLHDFGGWPTGHASLAAPPPEHTGNTVRLRDNPGPGSRIFPSPACVS